MDKITRCISGGYIIVGDGFYLWVHEGRHIIFDDANKVSVQGNDFIDCKLVA